MTKKLVSLLVAALMLFALIPSGALARTLEAPAKETVVAASWDFETDPVEDGWLFLDADGDNYNWEWTNEYAASGSYSIRSCSYQDYTALAPDNWAISPAVELPEGTAALTFNTKQYNTYSDVYRVYVGASPDIEAMEPVTDDLNPYPEFYPEEVDLSDYAGGTVYIAFRHYNCEDEWMFYIDDVEITCEAAEEPDEQEISEVRVLGFEPPIAGEYSGDHLDLYVPEDAHYHIEIESDYPVWWDNDPAVDFIFEGEFVEGNPYSVGLTVVAEEGCFFAEDCAFYVNGDESLVDYTYTGVEQEDNTIAYVWTIPIEAEAENIIIIDEIYVDGFEFPPIAGENADEHLHLTLPEDAPYFFFYEEDVSWFDEAADDMFHGEFVLGDMYSVFVPIGLPSGYRFAEDTRVYVNGREDLVSGFVFNFGEFLNFYTAPMAAVDGSAEPIAINSVNVNGMIRPAAGETAEQFMSLFVDEDAPYTLMEVEAYDLYNDDFTMVTPETVFEAGHSYIVGCTVLADYGYYFAEDCEFLANGTTELVDPDLSGIYTEQLAGVTSIVMECEEDDPFAIHEVWVDGWGTPVEGVAGIDHVFLSTPEDAPYYIIYGGWLDETDQQQMWSEEHVFIAGHEYSEGCQIWAEEGYYFAEDCVFLTHDGDELLDDDWCYVDPEENYICYMNSVPEVCEGGEEGLLGDVDGNGVVAIPDAILIMRYAMGLIELDEGQLARADVYGSGNYGTANGILIMRYAMGLIDHFPAEE